jgi:hypothetical protein
MSNRSCLSSFRDQVRSQWTYWGTWTLTARDDWAPSFEVRATRETGGAMLPQHAISAKAWRCGAGHPGEMGRHVRCDRSLLIAMDLLFEAHPEGNDVPIDDLIIHYVLDLVGKGRSPRSIEHHRDTLTRFVAWLRAERHSDDPARWTPDQLTGFVNNQQTQARDRDQPLSAGSVNRMARSLRAFAAWLKSAGFVQHDLF